MDRPPPDPHGRAIRGDPTLSLIEKTGHLERRDPAMRRRRDEVAAWLEIHPRQLARVPVEVLDSMLVRAKRDTDRQHAFRELEATAHHWEEMARRDPLTGLPNRRAVEAILADELQRARRYDHTFTVLVCDLDGLKEINDRYGHEAGDTVLRTLAQRMVAGVRRTDTVGRWAGDEFVAVCPESDGDAAARIAEKLRARSTGPVHLVHGDVTATISIGWVVSKRDDSVDSLLRGADQAMYRAKASGRGRVSG